MKKPELIFIAGCNASGKSTFIRTRLNEFSGFEVIMTDAYKGRTKEVFKQALLRGKDIVLETVFNDESFKNLVDDARKAGYISSLIVLFLDSAEQSKDRVAIRGMQQGGITISGSNVDINFNESLKNIATYYFYFDKCDFIYTGIGGENQKIMSFRKSELITYQANNLQYPQRFAQFSFSKKRLDEDNFKIIITNRNFSRKI
ncbi:MAG TPA: zeta toxin family protein [Hanamia sp.]|nr:zeta toxin family protein [Hanamia sp.]